MRELKRLENTTKAFLHSATDVEIHFKIYSK